jgi:uncharacterized membrane protein YeaQ/YmgE (transglycosylase-associated protein family)
MHLYFILQILCGILVGWLAGIVVQGRGLGLLPDLIIGVLGAVLGGTFLSVLHIQMAGGVWGDLAVSVGGAVVLLIVIRMIKSN